MNKDNYKGIWVFAEHNKGTICPSVYEVLAKAQELKAHCGETVTAVLLGSDVKSLAPQLIAQGADQVIVAEDKNLAVYSARPYQQALTQLAEKYKPSILLYAATSTGRDLAPRLMISLKTGLTADAIDLGFDEDEVFYQTTPGYGGKIFAHIVINEKRPQMATVRTQMFEPLKPDASRTGEIITEKVAVEADDCYELLSESPKQSEDGSPAEAAILVSGGRGIKTEAQLELIKELAHALGGQVCGSRPLVESGLLPHSVQIGQSGLTVKPELMINVAVSGAIQYKVGMQGAKHIISINRDSHAAIMDFSDGAAVADYTSLIPAILAEIKKRK
jgi:electron transfer flavoprotein alpha subunit